jgi:tetratricopeptide (TPR) repeat protein
MIDFLSLCRTQYKGNKYQLTNLREFEQNYSSNNAIAWYTKQTFISQILNKSLKVQNIDLLFLLRFFIHDIEQQLKDCQCLIPIKVYRYQLMSNRELQLLRDSMGQFISINTFLLTNVNRDSVLPYSKSLLDANDFQSILFEINADPDLDRIKPFGNLTTQSYSNKTEDEVLFMLGSIFQLKSIRQDDNEIWIIEMTLSSKTNSTLESIFNNYKNDDDDEINLLSFGYILQKMNKSDDADKYYRRLFNELPDDDERIAQCCLNLGNIACQNNDYHSSLEWLLKSLDMSLRTLPSDDTFFAVIYNSMGYVYNAQNDSKAALECYDKAVNIWKPSIDEDYLNMAECMNNIGIIYKHEKNYLVALEYFKKRLNIMTKYLSHDHIDLSKSHCNIASIYRQLGEYDFALEHYNLSLKILKKHYSPEHPNIAKGLENIGSAYALKGEEEKALLYYEKAAEIYRQTLPPTHINNIKIDQLIRNVLSPHRKISFLSDC